MRKKVIALAVFALTFFAIRSEAQSNYSTAVGLGIDFGDGSTLVGPAAKHFFSANNVGQAEVLFGNRTTFINLFYQYHQNIPNAAGLKWYLGVGPSIALFDGGSDVFIRPMAGLDYKITNVPLNFAFDWRPAIYLGNNGSGSAGRFGLGFRYAF